MTAAPDAYQFGPFRLDVREHRLTRDGVTVPLTPKVFAILRVLVEHAGHLVTKEDLLKEVWPDSFVEEGALNRAVSVLRKALDDRASSQTYIETVPTRGYRFVGQVARADAASDDGRRGGVARRTPRAWKIAAGALAAALAATGWMYRPRPAGARPDPPAAPAPVHRQVTFTGREGAPTISADGRRIAYISIDRPDKKLIVQELAGGRPLEIFSAPELNYLRWSPDGQELLVWARGGTAQGIYIVPQLGGTPRLIARGLVFLSCWSPDGSTIAVAGALDGKIRFFDRRGLEQRSVTLAGDHWSIWDLDWSADGKRLLFVSSSRAGSYEIGTIRADGSGQQRILSSPTEIPSTRWVPHADAIYYLQRINQTMSLFRIPATAEAGTPASAATAVLTGLETDRFFALSGDATRLVYARAPYYSNLRLLDAATGRTAELTQGTSLVERPSVSPDGTSVVFNIGHDPRTNLYTMPIAGGTPKQLTFFNALTVSGAWSADGREIAFASTQGGRARVWTMAAAGAPMRPVSAGEVSDNLDVVWGPGRRILYQGAGNRTYHEIDRDAASERPLTGSPGAMFAPTYSPRGDRIAVMWTRPPARGIWTIDPARGTEQPLYRSNASSILPIGWSGDAAWIYIVEGRNGPFRGATSFIGETTTDAKVLRIRAEGGAVQPVATLPGDEIGRVAMTPDGRRFVYPVFSSRSDVWIVEDFDGPAAAR